MVGGTVTKGAGTANNQVVMRRPCLAVTSTKSPALAGVNSTGECNGEVLWLHGRGSWVFTHSGSWTLRPPFLANNIALPIDLHIIQWP
jgi:hypothetical protein